MCVCLYMKGRIPIHHIPKFIPQKYHIHLFTYITCDVALFWRGIYSCVYIIVRGMCLIRSILLVYPNQKDKKTTELRDTNKYLRNLSIYHACVCLRFSWITLTKRTMFYTNCFIYEISKISGLHIRTELENPIHIHLYSKSKSHVCGSISQFKRMMNWFWSFVIEIFLLNECLCKYFDKQIRIFKAEIKEKKFKDTYPYIYQSFTLFPYFVCVCVW